MLCGYQKRRKNLQPSLHPPTKKKKSRPLGTYPSAMPFPMGWWAPKGGQHPWSTAWCWGIEPHNVPGVPAAVMPQIGAGLAGTPAPSGVFSPPPEPSPAGTSRPPHQCAFVWLCCDLFGESGASLCVPICRRGIYSLLPARAAKHAGSWTPLPRVLARKAGPLQGHPTASLTPGA